MANRWVYRRPSFAYLSRRYISVFGTALAATFDPRTVSADIGLALVKGDKLRLRAIQTEGASDLQIIKDGSAITIEFFR